MNTLAYIRHVVSFIQYKDWTFRVEDDVNCAFLQVVFDAPDNTNPELTETQYCRKWRISYHSTDTEIVRTAWKAVLAAEEHEAAEQFRFNGVDIYNPHIDVRSMVDFVRTAQQDVR